MVDRRPENEFLNKSEQNVSCTGDILKVPEKTFKIATQLVCEASLDFFTCISRCDSIDPK